MARILLIDPTPAPFVERLRRLFLADADLAVVPSYSEEDLSRLAAEAEILLVIHRKVDAHSHQRKQKGPISRMIARVNTLQIRAKEEGTQQKKFMV